MAKALSHNFSVNFLLIELLMFLKRKTHINEVLLISENTDREALGCDQIFEVYLQS